eukprot:TRINITY_DN96389_c0_g1_i1.p1 TRINITY_DN96389_c0_g1~~TRINITY_DN96389_c0_g1_i1.p1  ORF type:complete len:437 (-),score=50.85 TRINITY_DN96389_c0_g1_i1:81-1265(-)
MLTSRLYMAHDRPRLEVAILDRSGQVVPLIPDSNHPVAKSLVLLATVGMDSDTHKFLLGWGTAVATTQGIFSVRHNWSYEVPQRKITPHALYATRALPENLAAVRQFVTQKGLECKLSLVFAEAEEAEEWLLAIGFRRCDVSTKEEITVQDPVTHGLSTSVDGIIELVGLDLGTDPVEFGSLPQQGDEITALGISGSSTVNIASTQETLALPVLSVLSSHGTVVSVGKSVVAFAASSTSGCSGGALLNAQNKLVGLIVGSSIGSAYTQVVCQSLRTDAAFLRTLLSQKGSSSTDLAPQPKRFFLDRLLSPHALEGTSLEDLLKLTTTDRAAFMECHSRVGYLAEKVTKQLEGNINVASMRAAIDVLERDADESSTRLDVVHNLGLLLPNVQTST